MPDMYEPDGITLSEAIMHADTFMLKFTKENRITHAFLLDWAAIDFLATELNNLRAAYNRT